MGNHFHVCIETQKNISKDKFAAFMDKYSFNFADCKYSMCPDEDFVITSEVRNSIDFAEFIQEINKGSNPKATFEGKNFNFALGFFTRNSRRYTIFLTEELSMHNLAQFLTNKDSSLLRFFEELFQMLGGINIVVGVNSDYEVIFGFIDKTLDEDDWDLILAAAGFSKEHMRVFEEIGESFVIAGIQGIDSGFVKLGLY